MKELLAFLLVFLALKLAAQDVPEHECRENLEFIDGMQVLAVAEKMPELKGGMQEIFQINHDEFGISSESGGLSGFRACSISDTHVRSCKKCVCPQKILWCTDFSIGKRSAETGESISGMDTW